MSENCNNDCASCKSDCGVPKFKLHEKSSIKRTIGVVSGKGGVGKSMVTSLLAVIANRKGLNTAILDADITGPSIPRAFGIKERAKSADGALLPSKSKTGIQLMSINLLLDSTTDPVVWRGPVIAGAVKQFYTDVIWDNVDVMFIDMPPGTGDVPLTVFQSIPLDGLIIVTTPQELVSMIVEKAINMAKLMDVPVLGIVENMSYVECPDCSKRIELFGKSGNRDASLPLDPRLTAACDAGMIELFEGDWLDELAEKIL